jgi:hypothetical protein
MIYAQIDSKGTIIEEVLDRAIAELTHQPDDRVPWPDELRGLMTSLRAHLGLHPWLTKLSQQTVPPSLHAFGDSVQSVVARAGLNTDQARMYRRLIAWTVWGFATVEAGAPNIGRPPRPAGEVPVDVDELFATAIDGIIRSIEAAAISEQGATNDRAERSGGGRGQRRHPLRRSDRSHLIDSSTPTDRERDGDEQG